MHVSQRVFILASNSFAGGHFADFCLHQGAEVFGVSRSPEPMDPLIGYGQNPRRAKSFRFAQIDLNRDFNQLVELLQEFKPQWVIDFAGQGMVAQSWQAPHQWYQTNIVAKVRVHEALRQMDFLKVYLRFSTPEVYGHTDKPLTEESRLNPSTPYAVSHAAIDMSTLAYQKQYGFPAILTRASNIYGPQQQLYRIIPRALLYGLTGRKLKLDGGGLTVRNFVYMPDVCEALWKICENPHFGEVYHLASDEYVSIRELVERAASRLGIPLSQLAEVGPDRPGKDRAYYLDIAKIQREYGWASKTSLETGLEETLKWIRRDLSVLEKTPLEYLHKE